MGRVVQHDKDSSSQFPSSSATTQASDQQPEDAREELARHEEVDVSVTTQVAGTQDVGLSQPSRAENLARDYGADLAWMLLEASQDGAASGVLVAALTECPHIQGSSAEQVTATPSAATSSAATPGSTSGLAAGPSQVPMHRSSQSAFPIIDSFPPFDTVCSVCADPSENWLCLHCGEVACGRYVGGHMLQHHQRTGHPVAFGYRDLSVWCFCCDSYLDALRIPELQLAFVELHRMKFGSRPPVPAAGD